MPDEIRHAAAAPRARPLARAARRPRGRARSTPTASTCSSRFEGELVLHSHLRMTGAWGVYAAGRRWRRSPRRAWLVLRAGGHEVVQFDGPVLELMTDGRRAVRPAARRRSAPTCWRRSSTRERFLRRLRADDPTRGDRRRAARPAQRRRDREHLEGRGLLGGGDRPVAPGRRRVRRRGAGGRSTALRPRMLALGAERPAGDRAARATGGAGGRARAAGRRSAPRGQGDDNRTTYWCPGCQR